MAILQSLRGYRTLIVNAIAVIVAALVAIGVLPASEFAGITEETVGEQFDNLAAHVDAIIASVLAILAFVNGALRFFTKTPVGHAD